MPTRSPHWPLLCAATLALLPARTHPQDAPPSPAPDAAIEGLRSQDLETRRAAATRLRFAEAAVQKQALPHFNDRLMNEKDGQVRLAVLDAVTALGPDAEPAIPALVHSMRTKYGGQAREEMHQHYRAALALAAIGKPAVPALCELLDERAENVKAESIMALGRIGPNAASAVPSLVPFLGHTNDRIRREAILTLGKIGTPALEPLLSTARSTQPIARAAAVESLMHVQPPDERIAQAVLAAAADEDASVRAAGLKALARLDLPPESVLPLISENIDHQNDQVRIAVVNLLAHRTDWLQAIAPRLEPLLHTDDTGAARHAAFLLHQLGPQAIPTFLHALEHEQSQIEPIAESLALIGRPAVAQLTKALHASNPRSRRGAALALAQIRPLPDGLTSALNTGLGDPDTNVRADFLTAISHLERNAAEFTPAVRALLADPSPEIRLKALQILSRTTPRDTDFIQSLESLLGDTDPRIQKQAIDTLRSVGSQASAALPTVIQKLNSEHPDVRLAAAEFVGNHGADAAQAVPALTAMLEDQTLELRTIAAQTLGKLGKAAQPALEQLAALAHSENPALRETAISTLASLELDAQTLRPYLAKALRDTDQTVRRAAGRAIQRLGPHASILLPDIVLLAETKENAEAVERLLRRFERTSPDPRSIPELITQLDHEQAAVRLLAIKFLGLAGQNASAALPTLERLAADSDEAIRTQAAKAIEQIRTAHAQPTPSPE